MSLFGSIGKVFKSVAKAVPVLGSVISANDSKKAVGRANDATQLGITNAKGSLNDQLAATMAQLAPYQTAGTDALTGIRGLVGLNGNDQQQSSIDALKASPLYQSLFGTGQDAVLGAASATGGLRGGNVNDALFDNGRDTLAQVIQQQLQNLGGLASGGLGATEFGGNLGAQNAGALAQLETGAGQSNAGAILGHQSIDNNLFSGLRTTVQNAITAGAGGIPSAGGGGGIGGGSGGFDFSAALKSVLGGGGGLSGTPLGAVSGGGSNTATSAIPTGYKF